jgi:hypothetical protein
MFFVKKNNLLTGGTRSAQELPYHWIKKDSCRTSGGAAERRSEDLWQV